jgi:DNA-binding Lrp family transcriptional regulator
MNRLGRRWKMATTAFILIETQVGKMGQVTGQLQGVSGIEEVHPVTGPYDVIASVNVSSLEAVGDFVSDNIHKIEGVTRTVTCLSMNGGG